MYIIALERQFFIQLVITCTHTHIHAHIHAHTTHTQHTYAHYILSNHYSLTKTGAFLIDLFGRSGNEVVTHIDKKQLHLKYFILIPISCVQFPQKLSNSIFHRYRIWFDSPHLCIIPQNMQVIILYSICVLYVSMYLCTHVSTYSMYARCQWI